MIRTGLAVADNAMRTLQPNPPSQAVRRDLRLTRLWLLRVEYSENKALRYTLPVTLYWIYLQTCHPSGPQESWLYMSPRSRRKISNATTTNQSDTRRSKSAHLAIVRSASELLGVIKRVTN